MVFSNSWRVEAWSVLSEPTSVLVKVSALTVLVPLKVSAGKAGVQWCQVVIAAQGPSDSLAFYWAASVTAA